MAVHNFEDDNKIGENGEKIFKEFMESHNLKYTDVSKVDEYQDIDVDFIVHLENGKILVEVKNDTRIHSTDNIFYETISNVDFGTPGCFEKTKSNVIVICSEQDKTLYIVKTADLRNYVHQNKNSLRFVERVSGSNSAGYLVPKSRIMDKLTILKYK